MDLLGLKENGISKSNLYKLLIYFKDINLTEELCIPVFTLYCYYSVHFSFIYLGGGGLFQCSAVLAVCSENQK